MDRRKRTIFGVVVIVFLVVLAIYFNVKRGEKENWVVYLSTGEVYVGNLTTFPHWEMKNSYILTTITDPNDSSKTNFQLNPLDKSLWEPKHLYINRDEVVFYGIVGEKSKIGEALKGDQNKEEEI